MPAMVDTDLARPRLNHLSAFGDGRLVGTERAPLSPTQRIYIQRQQARPGRIPYFYAMVIASGIPHNDNGCTRGRGMLPLAK